MIAFASSLDQAGIMTCSAEDAALIFNGMLGFDPKDSTSVDRAPEDYTRGLDAGVKGLRIGLAQGVFRRRFAAGRREGGARSPGQSTFRQGAKLVDISLPNAALGIPVYYVIAPADARRT
jgi:aspartyl-tRNA(Asn)/glutamyl-tRNA(Gln) amidotransferase subunit A